MWLKEKRCLWWNLHHFQAIEIISQNLSLSLSLFLLDKSLIRCSVCVHLPIESHVLMICVKCSITYLEHIKHAKLTNIQILPGPLLILYFYISGYHFCSFLNWVFWWKLEHLQQSIKMIISVKLQTQTHKSTCKPPTLDYFHLQYEEVPDWNIGMITPAISLMENIYRVNTTR